MLMQKYFVRAGKAGSRKRHEIRDQARQDPYLISDNDLKALLYTDYERIRGASLCQSRVGCRIIAARI